MPGPRLRRRLIGLYAALHDAYGPQRWWPARGRFEIAVGAILVQHTAWAGAERAIERLRAAGCLDVPRLAGAGTTQIERLVRPAGTFRLKARRLKALARFVMGRFQGRMSRLARAPLPTLRADLLRVAGIGPETADSILLYAAHRPVFVADAYARRVLSRHGLVAPDVGYEALRALIERHLPRDPALHNEYHALLVAVGKRHCRSRPRCQGCPLRWDLRGRPPRG